MPRRVEACLGGPFLIPHPHLLAAMGAHDNLLGRRQAGVEFCHGEVPPHDAQYVSDALLDPDAVFGEPAAAGERRAAFVALRQVDGEVCEVRGGAPDLEGE